MSWKSLSADSESYTFEYFLTEYVCRICWCQNAEKEITSLSEGEPSVTLAEKIFECVGIDLTINSHPSKICANCCNEVKNISEFRRFCHENEKKLFDILRTGPQKTEDYKDFLEKYEPSERFELELTDTYLYEDDKSNGMIESLPKLMPKLLKRKKMRTCTYCYSCRSDLESKDELSKHNLEYHGINTENGMFKCFGCEKAFLKRAKRLRHETESCVALKNGYQCAKCAVFLPKRRIYESHLRNHSDNKHDVWKELYKCKKCLINFESLELLNEHMTSHEKDKKNWVCDTCGRVFLRRDYLYKHKLMHDGIKLHACPHCDFRATQKSSLNVHIRKHTGERPYRCELCPQRCVNKSNLLSHMRRHLGVKQFACNLCDKKFGYKKSLEEHISSTHERSELHSCEDCGATYSRSRGLRRHLLAKHGKQAKGAKMSVENEPNDSKVKTDFVKKVVIENTDVFMV